MNVIIVEDDKVISLLLTKMIERIGLTVLDVISKGQDAIYEIPRLRPDLIFMDIMLEDEISGIEVMKQIRKYSLEIPVIYITGNSDQYTKQQAQETEYLDFLIKPVSMDELTRSVKKIA